MPLTKYQLFVKNFAKQNPGLGRNLFHAASLKWKQTGGGNDDLEEFKVALKELQDTRKYYKEYLPNSKKTDGEVLHMMKGAMNGEILPHRVIWPIYEDEYPGMYEEVTFTLEMCEGALFTATSRLYRKNIILSDQQLETFLNETL